MKVLIITHTIQNKQRLLRFFEQQGMKTEIFEFSAEHESDLRIKLKLNPTNQYHALFIMDEPG